MLDAEVRIGELMLEMPKTSGGDRRSENFKIQDALNFEKPNNNKYHEIRDASNLVKTKAETTSELGYSKDQVSQFQQLASHRKLLSDIPKVSNNQYTKVPLLTTEEKQTKAQQIEELGFSRQQAERMQTMAKHEDIFTFT